MRNRTTRLDQTLGSIQPEQLEATRKNVEEEITQSQSLDVQEMSKEPPKEEVDSRTEKLDLLMDIQLILVDRFAKLSLGMKVVLALVTLFTFTMALGLIVGLGVRNQIETLIEEQKNLMSQIQRTQQAVQVVAKQVPEIEVDPATGATNLLVPKRNPPGDAPASKDSGVDTGPVHKVRIPIIEGSHP